MADKVTARYPTFHVQCLTRRRAPLYAATVVGKPPMEDAWLGKATERIFLPLLQMVVPEIVDYNLPVEGGFHNLLIVSIKKSYPGQAKKVMNALWGLGHMMMLTRCLIVVDADVDVHDTRSVAWFVLNNLDPSRDLVVMPGPVDDLNHSGSYLPSVGHKLGVDATRKTPDEGYQRVWPPEIVMDEATRTLVTRGYPFAGSRMLRDLLRGEGVVIGREHVTTMMRLMRIETLYRRPDTSKPAAETQNLPYLLRGLVVDRPNQVWATDITYIPMARGFVYLTAVHSARTYSGGLGAEPPCFPPMATAFTQFA